MAVQTGTPAEDLVEVPRVLKIKTETKKRSTVWFAVETGASRYSTEVINLSRNTNTGIKTGPGETAMGLRGTTHGRGNAKN